MTLSRILSSVLLLAGVLAIGGCQSTRNFTTYYNLFYNMERIMDEAEEELLYIREQKSPEPTFHIAYDDQLLRGQREYNHLQRRSMTKEEKDANKVKLDSIVIKGSKLLARAPNSDYVDDAVFYISKSYFYQREWFASQKKAEELIKNFPDSRWLPDAHVVLAMDLLHQGNPRRALTVLSQAIDVGWAHERVDILVEAFRLNADIHLADGNVVEAVRPFERAVSLSDNDEERARWYHEIGVVYFRYGQYDQALASFEKAIESDPDYFTEFQSGLQRAVTLRTLGRLDEATAQLEELYDNGNFEAWRGLVAIEQLNLASQRGEQVADSTLAAVDSTYPGRSYAAYGIYERGVRAFRDGNFDAALGYFQKVQSMPAPFQRKAQLLAMRLGQYYEYHAKLQALNGYPINPFPDSVRSALADVHYNLARLFTTFERTDSAMNYYALSEQWAPLGSVAAARVRFARASMARVAGRNREADSLLEILVADYGLTEYAAEARRQLGYTEAELTDPAKDDYLSGTSFMRIGDNPNAISQFHRVIDRYPSSDYALRSYYAMGLLYERSLEQPDSAFRYYSELLNRYPLSEQAQEVRPIVDAYLQSMTRGGRRGGAAEPPSEQPSAPYNNDPNVTVDPNGVPRFGEGALPLQETPTAPADSSKIPPVERRLPPP